MKTVDLNTAQALEVLGYDGEYDFYVDSDGNIHGRERLYAHSIAMIKEEYSRKTR